MTTKGLVAVFVGGLAVGCADQGASQPGSVEPAPVEVAEAVAAPSVAVTEQGIRFPADYLSLHNYLSLDRTQNPDQIIRLFANDTALAGPAEEGGLAFGSVLVAEVYKAKLDEDGEVVTSALGRRMRDKLALIAVMEKRQEFSGTHAAALANGHWEFAAFTPDGAVADKNLDTCRACHAPLGATDHLFSIEHLAQR
ncbi:MAG: cytochrome P460 family protein [Myxococcales bacterium]|nr:cytochrome P460 family protein [Myxococcales bacterium]